MICKLCLQEKPLLKSHIIPEFCYKPIYDEKHKIHELSSNPDTPNKHFMQKGIREKLLCLSCEQLLSPSEKYVREVLFGGTRIAILQDSNPLVLGEVDYNKFKHFQLSILWRAGVSSHEYFKNVKLGLHEEKLRVMVLDNIVGKPFEYGCGVVAIITETFQPKGKIDVIDGLMISPDRIRSKGHIAYRFIFGGNMWIFIVSRHSNYFPLQELFVSEDGKLTIPLMKAEDTEYFTKFAKVLRGGGKLK